MTEDHTVVRSDGGSSLISPDTPFYELEGGTAVLPDALLERVRKEVRFDRRVTRIEYHHPDRASSDTEHVRGKGPHVWVDTVSEGRDGPVVREQFTADVTVVTVPFSGLRHVQTEPPMSYGKRRAVCELHYDSATKVLLEFSRRWWELGEADWKRELNAIEPGLYDAYRTGRATADGSLPGAHPSVPDGHISAGQRTHYAANRALMRDQPEAVDVVGGGSVSDNANRFMFHPSHPVPGSEGGRGPDDLQLGGRRAALGLPGRRGTVPARPVRPPAGLRPAHRGLPHRPGQHTELLPAIPVREGPLHFAGDHTSVKPAWIEGAVESAVRAALEIHTA